MCTLAPIAVSTYIRLTHLQQTVNALKRNTLAPESDLYFFSDAPKLGDENKVQKTRQYLRTITGFKSVNIIERKTNNRVKNNRGGMKSLLGHFGKVIFLEEDIVTAPGFLSFVNQALDKYEKNEQIFSITGYSPPIPIPNGFNQDLFILRRFNAWGVGIWKDRFQQVRHITPTEYTKFITKRNQVQSFIDGGGADMLKMLKNDVYGNLDAFDVKAMYAQFLSDQYTVYPTKSLTFNIGMDGTGIHSGKTTFFDVSLSTKTSFDLPDNPCFDMEISKENLHFRNRNNFFKRNLRKTRELLMKCIR